MSMAGTRGARARGTQIALHLGLILACLSVLLPILWVTRVAIVPSAMSYSPGLLPEVSSENFHDLFAGRFPLSYLNSLVVAAGSVVLAMPFAVTLGYSFARFGTAGRIGRFSVLATQMLPPVALVLPAFAILRSLGLTDNLFGLILVYGALNLPFLTWIMMGFFKGIPVDLEWAAMSDGATAFQAFRIVVLPTALPGMAAAGVLGFILSWNEFLFALVISGPRTATIPVALAGLQTSNGVKIGIVAAGVVLAVLPLIVASRFIQRFIVEGLTFGAVK